MPERYAIDFVQLGADGQTYSGEKHRNTSYHCYGLPIRAVADGRVVSVTDGITENVPNSGTLAPGLTIARLSGNDVVERIGPSTYAGYAHMIPGSLKVKPGDQVHAGQVLGLLGNSGNSTEPHLHFQLCDGPTFLECEGLPQEFRRFTLENYKTTTNADGTGKLSIGGRSEVTDQGLLENELVSFPAAH